MSYVQVRFESKKNDKALGMVLHNTRKVKPGYLKNHLEHNKETNTIYINNNNGFDEYNITDKTIQTQVNNILKKQLKQELEQVKQNKSFREKKHAITQDSVITLSNSINTMYKNKQIDKKKLNTLFLKSVKELEKELGLKALNVSVHYDETTPHAHASFKNYYNGKSINNKLKKQYSKAQDIVGEVWSTIGFTRGKKGSKEKHLSVREMHKKEREIESIKKEKQLIVKQIKNIFGKNRGLIGFNETGLLKDLYNYTINTSKLNYTNKEIQELKEQLENNTQEFERQENLLWNEKEEYKRKWQQELIKKTPNGNREEEIEELKEENKTHKNNIEYLQQKNKELENNLNNIKYLQEQIYFLEEQEENELIKRREL